MESSEGGRCGVVAGDLAVLLVTVVQLIFLVYYHEYVAWYIAGPDGDITRLPVLNADYSSWLPFPVAASLLVFVLSIVLLFFDRYWFRQAAWILFCLAGIVVVVSLLVIFPFDFSVIPKPAVARIVPKVLSAFLVFMVAFYGIAVLVQSVQLWRQKGKAG